MEPETYQPILNHWNVGTIQSIKAPSVGGTIDGVQLITTTQGRYALRASAHNDATRLQQEHDLILWAHQNNIHTPPPLPTPQGNIIVTHQKQVYTLFPLVDGNQVARKDLTTHHITAMGTFLAQIHTILADYPTSNVRNRNLETEVHTERDKILATIDRLINKISSLPSPDETDHHALHRLKTRRDWLSTQTDQKKSQLFTLPFQVTHGDYQETNLFFQNNHVSAIIDWSAYAAPTTWEIARILHIVFHFQADPSIAFLKAYQQHHPLSLDDLNIATYAYGRKNAYSLWLYEDTYDKGNQKLRQFITPGSFTPLEHDWETLYPILQRNLI